MVSLRNFIRMVVILLTCLLLLASVKMVNGQDEEVIIVFDRVETTNFPAVNAYAAIYDKNGVPLDNISQDSITILEDNTDISGFSIAQETDQRLPLAVTLLLDISGSMEQGTPTPLSDAISAAEAFINQLKSQDSIGVMTFSDEVTIAQPLTTERAVAIRALEGLSASGNTCMYDAIYEGVTYLSTSGMKNVIILITDGVESGTSTHSLEEALTAAKDWHIPVYPVGFGYIDEDELQEIAKETGGFSQISPDSTTLDDSFGIIQEQLRNLYHLNYTSNLPADNTERQLSLTYKPADTTYSANTTFIPKPLEVNLTSPDPGETISIQTTLIAEPVSVAKISSVRFLLDDLDLTSLTFPTNGENTYSTDLDLRDVAIGEHQISAVSQDVLGNSNRADITVTVREPILITIDNPSDQDHIVTSPMIEVEVDSVRDIQSARILINNEEWQTFSSASFAEQWQVHSVKDGNYQISVEVVDVEGHTSTQSIMVTKGDISPGSLETEEVDPQATPIPGGGIGSFGSMNNSMILIAGLGLGLILLLIVIPLIFKRKRTRKSAESKNEQLILREVQGQNPDTEWPLEQEEITLGRKQDENDIPLKGLSASREMAVIRRSEEGWVITSLNPQNPITINDISIPQQALLEAGDKIVMGESEFLVENKVQN